MTTPRLLAIGHTGPAFSPTPRQAQIHYDIAALLLESLMLSQGMVVDPALVPSGTKERLAHIAAHACQLVDPNYRVRLAADAVAETEDWMAGPYDGPGTTPTHGDIARYAIAAFCALEVK